LLTPLEPIADMGGDVSQSTGHIFAKFPESDFQRYSSTDQSGDLFVQSNEIFRGYSANRYVFTTRHERILSRNQEPIQRRC
jgi:hypothetical protein